MLPQIGVHDRLFKGALIYTGWGPSAYESTPRVSNGNKREMKECCDGKSQN